MPFIRYTSEYKTLESRIEVNIHIDFALEASLMFALYALSRRR